MSRYEIRVKSPDQRQHEIALRVKEAVDRRDTRQEFKFRGGQDKLALITVPLDYPIYRLENYRTRDQQLSLIARGKAPAGFFDPKRREDPSVQKQQHELLIDQAQRGSGESIKPIYDELRRTAKQTEHLIVTHDGVVVNGNRRLAAMRELVAEDSLAYVLFKDVLCLVLPKSATPTEILTLEIGLQMQPDTKLPYEWTALGRAVSDLRLQNVTDEDIAKLMNREKPDVQRHASMVEAADLYLSEWLGQPNAYHLLDGTEQAFKQVATRNWSNTEHSELREHTRKFDFFLIENRDEIVAERAYSLINAIEQNPPEFLKQVATEWDIDLPKKPPLAADLEISFDDPDDHQTDYTPLLAKLTAARTNKDAAKARVDQLVQVCQIIGEQNKEKDKAALRFSRNARKSLDAIDLRGADPATLGEIFTNLRECERKCTELTEQLDRMKPKAG